VSQSLTERHLGIVLEQRNTQEWRADEVLGASQSLVAIGNFDGVHRGHQAVLAAACDAARQRELVPVVLTFDPHPTVAVGRPPPAFLTSLSRKIELLQAVDSNLRVVVEHFDRAFAAQAPEAFAQRILVHKLRAKCVRVGENFRFGSGRSGDLALLRELGARMGFEAMATSLMGDALGRYSSTRAREAIAAGHLSVAWEVLGRPHALIGEVVQGQRLAHRLGFPTANLAWVLEALPPHGVYAVVVDIEDDEGRARRLAKGVANLGVRPTIDAGFAVEVHLLDFAGDLYGKRLRVHLLDFIRPERRFGGIDELKAQIGRDVEAGRSALDGARGKAWESEAWF
jgi:riboflavin kinase/FMN adenylyltransferase